ncbi:hypothetical protein [Nakamurella sp. PAMC28650]|uniref:hypothetical protein n=1 Tax=Nakamurella sp. PAMC28650 TaxID=2762325 RepID=UPI001C9A3AD9|nr:hypothetical protein [Nakamurella sp. PAMC28650]
MVGPRTTWISWAMASSARRPPTSSALSWLQAEARRVALGNSETCRPPVNFRPRTPVGPSDRAISPSPIDGSGVIVNAVWPVSRVTLRSSGRPATSASNRSAVGAVGSVTGVLLLPFWDIVILGRSGWSNRVRARTCPT